MKDINLYEINDGALIENQIPRLVTALFGVDTAAVVSGDCFIIKKAFMETKQNFLCVDSKGKYMVGTNECIFAQDQLLDKHNLVLGKLKTRPEYVTYDDNKQKIIAFKRQLLVLEQEWIKGYTGYIKRLLSNRVSEGIPIIQHDAIRLNWADLVEREDGLEKISTKLIDNCIDENTVGNVFEVASRLVRESCDFLAKLAGGRAFLAGQAVEAMWLFGVFNKIYFTYGEQ